MYSQTDEEAVEISDLEQEVPTIKKGLNDACKVKMKLSITTRAIEPVVVPQSDKMYWCYLLRIDGADVTMGSHHFELAKDGLVSESSTGDFDTIRETVAKSIKLPVASRELTPPEE
jgi:hypothetical protein